MLDKSFFCGGNSTKATSGINGANTRTQREKGIKDSADLFTSDTLKGGAKKPELVKMLCENSGDDVEWLMDRFYLDLSLVARVGGHSAPRTHRHFDIYGQIVRKTWVWRRMTQRTIWQLVPCDFVQNNWSSTALSGQTNDFWNRERVVLNLFSSFKRARSSGHCRRICCASDNTRWAIFGKQKIGDEA